MKTALFVAVLLAGTLAGVHLLRRGPPPAPAAGPAAAAEPQRIISLSPSLTESLFALGLGERVVGVTTYCDYPPEAKLKPKTGDWISPQLETIVELRPDLVVLQSEHRDVSKRLEDLGIPTLVLEQHTLDDFRQTLLRLGERCGAQARAKELTDDLEQRMARIAARTKGLPRPRVAVVVSRNYGSGAVGKAMLAGQGTFFTELLHAAGAANAYEDRMIAYPEVTAEHLLALAPDFIIEIAPDLAKVNVAPDQALRDWQSLPDLAAVRNGRVHVLTREYVAKPGPRFILLLEDLARLLHPEAGGR